VLHASKSIVLCCQVADFNAFFDRHGAPEPIPRSAGKEAAKQELHENRPLVRDLVTEIAPPAVSFERRNP
jgi:hypothetical protein